MSNLKLDIPSVLSIHQSLAIVIDPQLKVYQPRTVSNGLVYVQKLLVRKAHYIETPLVDEDGNLTTHPEINNAYLVKETNVSDIGGGFQTFERHYATKPDSWYDFEEVSYRTVYWGALNYRNRAGGGSTWDKTRKVLAKARRYYFTSKEVPTEAVPEGDTVAQDYANDFTRFYSIPPEGRLGRNWEDYITDEGRTIAIAPDRITKYMGEIYEFTRFTIDI